MLGGSACFTGREDRQPGQCWHFGWMTDSRWSLDFVRTTYALTVSAAPEHNAGATEATASKENNMLWILLLTTALSADPAASTRGSVSVLREPGLPAAGTGSQPERIATILEQAGFHVDLHSAAQWADPQVLNTSKVDIAVVPTGESFPAKARENFQRYLKDGGNFISIGGYAFNRLWVQDGTKWTDETTHTKAQREAALSPERSLLPNGSFELPGEIPVGGVQLDRQWRRDGPSAEVAQIEGMSGTRCAHVMLPPDQASGSRTFYLDFKPEAGQSYEIACRIRCEEIAGDGMAYAAVYEHAADGQIVEFRDFVTRRGTSDWSEARYEFTPNERVARVRVQFGLYLATGQAWFDDFRLANVTGLTAPRMNTASGVPADGLHTRPEQIGVFDPSYPLTRVRELRSAGNCLLAADCRLGADIRGWAASGVVGDNNARWIPMLEAYDRFGRSRGPAASVMFHYNGHYRGSAWGFWGVDNLDLFTDANSPMSKALAEMAAHVARETYLHNLQTDQRLYRDGETVRVTAVVENRGRIPQNVRIEMHADETPFGTPHRLVSIPLKSQTLTLESGASRKIEAEFSPPKFSGDAGLIYAKVEIDGRTIDEMETGYVVDRPEVARSAAPSRMSGNYFTHGNRPLFLFGTDTYSYTYFSAFDNPLTWARDHRACRDYGIQVYENLQFSRPGHQLTEADWRSFRAMAQLTQKHNLVFMPGMLIGENVAVGAEGLNEQSALCRSYAQNLHDLPALHYYINGDYQLNLNTNAAEMRTLWNQWLADKYHDRQSLERAWGNSNTGAWGDIALPPPNSGRWDDVAAMDRIRFELWLTLRWNEPHVRAVRESDTEHPIMSEYYQRPGGGLDLPLTIDGQDVADIGYFDELIRDIDRLPLAIRFNDLRARGKGITLGEYGVKTHPAWTVENGATHYHVQRTEEEQKQLFMAVAHYALGLGAAKVQNWCLADSQNRVFPWGLFYPNSFLPKDIAYTHRNQSAIWRFFAPRYEAPPLTLCVPSHLRIGNREQIGIDVAYRAVAGLLSSHFSFNVIDDQHLDAIPGTTRTILYPSPFTLDDRNYGHLLAWVRAGGKLIVTGDVGYDENRQPTRRERLQELAGVSFVSARYPHVERHRGEVVPVSFRILAVNPLRLRPCVESRVATAELLGTGDKDLPVLTRNKIGEGVVYWLADPIELDSEDPAAASRRLLYTALITATDIKPISVKPDADWLHAMVQPTAQGNLHVAFNTQRSAGSERVAFDTAAGPVTLQIRNRWPALAAVTAGGSVVAISADAMAEAGGEKLLEGRGLKAAISLDGKDLRKSEAVLYAPFETGSLAIPSHDTSFAAEAGEFRNGKWFTLEQIPVDGSTREITIDEDRATCLILLCRGDRMAHWQSLLEEAMTHPERMKTLY